MYNDPLTFTIPFMLMFFAAAIAFVLIRFLKHRERMAYAKQGMYPPDEPLSRSLRKGPTPRFRQGIILFMIGSMLTFGLLTIGFGPWLVGGLIPLGIGIALLIIGSMEMMAEDSTPFYLEDEEEDEPIPAGKLNN